MVFGFLVLSCGTRVSSFGHSFLFVEVVVFFFLAAGAPAASGLA